MFPVEEGKSTFSSGLISGYARWVFGLYIYIYIESGWPDFLILLQRRGYNSRFLKKKEKYQYQLDYNSLI
jgi:hypothetical protein